ncbi:replication factor C subunit 1, putative [Babesia caballi]|uniref:Replication factor C subunit 1, putative n=1 Tax=Babesia caballi TaxID=5871 RepID=A0AAV4LR09_BABCB|nr:replication factor C subunit 1, putative [Babesia caballi]
MTELAKGNIEATAAMIESFGLNRELVVDALTSLRLKSQVNLYEKIETRKKTALTKLLNMQGLKVAPTKRKKETVERIVDEDVEAEALAPSDSESSESDDELLKKNQRPAKKRATAKAGARGKK